MKKKDFLLIVPVLFLAILALVLPRLTAKPRQPLVIDRVTVVPYKDPPLPRAKGVNYSYLKYRDDTKVTVSGHFQFSWMDRHINKKRGAITQVADIHLVDGRGRKYYLLKASDTGGTHNISGGCDYNGTNFTMRYSGINLWQFPASAGTISLKSNYVDQDGFVLPFSVVVRK